MFSCKMCLAVLIGLHRIRISMEKVYQSPNLLLFIFFSGSAAQRGLWPPPFTRLLDHTQRRATVGRTPLDE
jgi:hypothetical protein